MSMEGISLSLNVGASYVSYKTPSELVSTYVLYGTYYGSLGYISVLMQGGIS